MELLFGQASGGTGTSGSNPLVSLLPLVVIFVIFYFLLIMPQQRKQKQHQKLMNSLQKGDKVVTSSGIYGVVANVKDHVVSVVIADGVKVDFDKGHIAGKVDIQKPEPTK
jgi:preprotein translocase subunit YajC